MIVRLETEEVSMLLVPPCATNMNVSLRAWLDSGTVFWYKQLRDQDNLILSYSQTAGAAGNFDLYGLPRTFAQNRAAIFDAQVSVVLNLLSSVLMYNSINIIDHTVDSGVYCWFWCIVLCKNSCEFSESQLIAVWMCNSLFNELLQAGKPLQGHTSFGFYKILSCTSHNRTRVDWKAAPTGWSKKKWHVST